jgi:hypothetical protein
MTRVDMALMVVLFVAGLGAGVTIGMITQQWWIAFLFIAAICGLAWWASG